MVGLETELEAIDLGDKRLNRRAQEVIGALGAKPRESIPGACGGWAETKGAYRLLSHESTTAQQILEPHYACSEQRIGEHQTVLCIQDTTELDYTGKDDIEGLGPLNYETRRGLYLHPTLAVTPERVCLGVLDAWMWTREPGSLGEKASPRRPIEEKESIRWLEGYQRVNELAERVDSTRLVYVSDREGDIYELFVEYEKARQNQAVCAEWLIRASSDRKVGEDDKLKASAAAAPVITTVEFDLPARKGQAARHVVQQLRVARVKLNAPYRVGQKLEPVTVTVLMAEEVDPPSGEEALCWWLLSSCEVNTPEQAAELLQWYLCRWQVEIFFKILKSGCQVEELQLEKLERLEPALALYMIIAWRVLYLTMLGRQCPELPCDVVFDQEEWQAIYIVTTRQAPPEQPPTLDQMVRMVAVFGGFLNRQSDGFPGPQSLWIGLQRCADFVLAMEAQRAMMAGQSYG